MSEPANAPTPRHVARNIGLQVAQHVWGLNGNPAKIAFSLEQAQLMCARAAEVAIERTLIDLDAAEHFTKEYLKRIST